MKKIYRVDLPDGTVKTRTSSRTYTHAIAVLTDRWWVSSFCGSLTLAEKELQAQQSLYSRRITDSNYRVKEYRILPVSAGEISPGPARGKSSG